MYTKKPSKKLTPIGEIDVITVSRIKAHIADLKCASHRSENIQALIDKWEIRLEILTRNHTQAERIAELAKTINSYKFKNRNDESISETNA